MVSETPEEEARQFAEAFAASTQPLESRLVEELYRFYSTGEAGEVYELSRQLAEIHAARKPYASLTRWVGQIQEPFLRRRIASLRQRFTDFQGDRELQRRLAALMEAYGAAAGELRHAPLPYRQPTDCGILDWSPAPEVSAGARREHFAALHSATPEQARIVAEILALRARLADERGAEGSAEFDPEQHIQELESSVAVPELCAELLDQTEAPYAELAARQAAALGVDELCWWDLGVRPAELHTELAKRFPRDAAADLAHETLAAIGLRLERYAIRIAIDPRPGRGQHAFRFPVQVPGDVRLLVRLEDGPRGVELLLHELGHAIYTSSIEQDAWEFRGPAGTSFTEAIGQLFARLCRQPEWLTGTAGLPPELVAPHRRAAAGEELIRLRFLLLLNHFERAARSSKPEELDALWGSLSRRYLHVAEEPELHSWASVRSSVLHPGHVQNLVLAELIAAQLRNHYVRNLGSLYPNEALGRRLTNDIFRHGARYPWPQLLQKITGRQLGTESLLRQLNEALSEAP